MNFSWVHLEIDLTQSIVIFTMLHNEHSCQKILHSILKFKA